ncbi:MAG: hypothetical protein N2Z70_00905 [Bdellovibrionaceae bacterium]|jgi:hypothetical protein|nr:hypothetical protein [Pseudobdellovibrionaceae bacterium]
MAQGLWTAILMIFCVLGNTWAQGLKLGSLQKVAVFPPQGIQDPELADRMWWAVRELLAEDGRFLVATRRLMLNRGVLQARGEFSAADAILMGRVLDSQMLLTMAVQGRQLRVRAWRSEDGFLLFDQTSEVLGSSQLAESALALAQRMTQELLQKIPYAGYQVRAPEGEPWMKSRDGENYVFVDLGKKSTSQWVGKTVVWAELNYATRPLLAYPPAQKRVLAQAQLVEWLPEGIFRARVLEQPQDRDFFLQPHVVYFPEALSKWATSGAATESTETRLSEDFISQQLRVTPMIREQKKEATFLGTILSLGLVLLVL